MSVNVATVWRALWSRVREERRTSKRYNLQRTATVYRSGVQQFAVVCDVSENGLFLLGEFMPSVGEQLQVIVKSSPHAIRVAGKVVRAKRDHACDNVGVAIRIDDSFMSNIIEDVLLTSEWFPEMQLRPSKGEVLAAA